MLSCHFHPALVVQLPVADAALQRLHASTCGANSQDPCSGSLERTADACAGAVRPLMGLRLMSTAAGPALIMKLARSEKKLCARAGGRRRASVGARVGVSLSTSQGACAKPKPETVYIITYGLELYGEGSSVLGGVRFFPSHSCPMTCKNDPYMDISYRNDYHYAHHPDRVHEATLAMPHANKKGSRGPGHYRIRSTARFRDSFAVCLSLLLSCLELQLGAARPSRT